MSKSVDDWRLQIQQLRALGEGFDHVPTAAFDTALDIAEQAVCAVERLIDEPPLRVLLHGPEDRW